MRMLMYCRCFFSTIFLRGRWRGQPEIERPLRAALMSCFDYGFEISRGDSYVISPSAAPIMMRGFASPPARLVAIGLRGFCGRILRHSVYAAERDS